GQAGTDVLVFNGSGAAEIIDLSANGARLRLTRNVANIVMDVDGMEQVNVNALGGADNITVNSLAGTFVAQINLNLASTIGGSSGDAQADAITVNGTAAVDAFNLTVVSGGVNVSGLAASVRITNSEAAFDTLVVHGLGGTDTFTIGTGVSSLIGVTTNQ
ncbi:MAG: calcium-binding protein, partial [Opitutaceae bacterium]|nr:calcium-binding protein [Verrucomicrobiales bacterium]